MGQSMQAGDGYTNTHDTKAKFHDLIEGDYAYLHNQLFLGKRFAQRWIGPYLVTQVINDQNIELLISLKRRQIHSAYQVKIENDCSKILQSIVLYQSFRIALLVLFPYCPNYPVFNIGIQPSVSICIYL
jgi:hypothetical protein